MKSLIILITILLAGCSKTVDHQHIVVMNKEVNLNYIPSLQHRIQLYDGETSSWYTASQYFFNSVDIGDTISNIVIR